MKIKNFFAIAALSVPHFAMAQEVNPGQWSTWDDIERIYPAGSGLNVVFKNLFYPDGECDGGRQFYVDTDDANYQVKASALLAAFSANRQVEIVWDGTTKDGAAGKCRGHLDRFQVR